MARGRFISDTIGEDFRLNALSLEAELLFLMTIPHLDRDGLISGHPRLLAGKVCPLREGLANNINKLVKEWIDAELVVGYHTKDGPVLYFCGFAKNQQGLRYDRETPSRFEPPPNYIRTKSGLTPEPSGDDVPEEEEDCEQCPAELRQNSGSSPAQGEVQVQVQVQDQVEGEESNDAGASPAPTAPSPDDPEQEPKDDPKQNSAVQVFRDVEHRWPNKTQMHEIATVIEDLELWREVVQEWNMRGYKPTNVAGMLQWYRQPSRFRDTVPKAENNGYANQPMSNGDRVRHYFAQKEAEHGNTADPA